LITSKLEIHNSYISNRNNEIKVAKEEEKRAYSGFIYMTYGSTLQINNTIATDIVSKRVGFIYAAE
jgi:hypothetical protein